MITLKSIPLRSATHPRPPLPAGPRRREVRAEVLHRLAVHRAVRRRRAIGRQNLAAAARAGHLSATSPRR